MNLLRDLFRRLRLARSWVVAQFAVTLGLILLGFAWTNLPDEHAWQVVLILLIVVLLTISALELQAGTMRGLADNDGKRVKLVWGALTLLVWIAVACAFWAVLDWCDVRIPQWAGYLSAPAQRGALFSFVHIYVGLQCVEWLLRWVVLPAKMIPYGMASAQWGWRLPVRRILRLLWNWRWWQGVLLAVMAGVALPACFLAGSDSEPIWYVLLKLAAAYLLGVGSWVLLLGWAATLFGPEDLSREDSLAAVPSLAGEPAGSRSVAVEIPPHDEVSPHE
ncbi:MAG: hypothetical protein P4K94_01230 [Terracidiphilus sp.]|nr:hypothetical protein [Terracidiphilus sp.]